MNKFKICNVLYMKQKKFGNVLYMYNHTSNARYLRLSNNTLYVYTCNVAYGLQFFDAILCAY